ncbi:MAG: helix-turn-helix domain-containing protein [Bacteroidetes bacterium]|nr:MAG: helix-turn-helix domain-containing protein [Bacteroidota bacterium]
MGMLGGIQVGVDWRWVLLGLWGSLPMLTQAQDMMLTSTTASYSLDGVYAYLLLPLNENVTQAWLDPWANQRLPAQSRDLLLAADQDHWFRVTLHNHTQGPQATSEWVIRFSLIATSIKYYLVQNGVVVHQGRSGGFTAYDQRTFRPGLRNSYGRFTLMPQQSATLYLHMRSTRRGVNPIFNPYILSSNEFYRERGNVRLFNGIFLGILLLMMLYNFFLYWQVKDSAFIYYSFFLLCLGGFAMYNSGYLADLLIPRVFPHYPQGLLYFKLLVYPIVVSYLLFLSKFMDLPKLLPDWYRVARWIMWLAVPTFLADLLLMYFTNYNYTWPDRVTVGYTWLFIIYLFAICGKVAWTKAGGRKRFFIIGGVFAMATGVAITAVQRMLSVDYHAIPFRITTMVEVVIFSLGLAYRQWELLHEQQINTVELERARLREQQRKKEAEDQAELAQAKDRFYTNLTHEFRTPLTVILALSEHLRHLSWLGYASSREQEKYLFQLGLIKRNGEQLLQHVNQLLDMSKSSAGKLTLRLTPGNVVEFARYTIASFQSLAEERQLQLQFQADWPVKSFPFDHDKLRYILNNLLVNALKFTPPGGTVSLSLSDALDDQPASAIRITVADTGIGMTASTQAHIFNPYFQVENPSLSGTGIGLTFTKELVELMGGSISVQSAPEQGSTFWVILPLRIPDQATSSQLAVPRPTAAVPMLPMLAPASEKIADYQPLLLILEDNADVRYFLEQLLQPTYQILTARDGEAGWKLAQEKLPDLIISDVLMPKLDGFALTQRLKSNTATSHIPIILLTAKTNDTSKLEGLAKGADAYIVKPFQREELLLQIQNLLHLRVAMQDFYQEKEPDKPSPAQTPEQQLLLKVTDFVQQQLANENLGVQDLADFLHLSPSQVYRKLRAISGMSPTRFIRQLRMSRAQALLCNSSDSIADIAYQVGFTDPNYFSRVFQKAFGQTPTQYRQGEC